MQTAMVGVRIDKQDAPDFFGWDDVNDLIRHAMKVVAVVPGEFYQGDLDNNGIHSMVWFSTIVLDDTGIDTTEPSAAIVRKEIIPSHDPTDEIPW